MQDDRLVLSLFDYSGTWSQPYVDAGYKVIRVDLKHPKGVTVVSPNLILIGDDLLAPTVALPAVSRVLAAPPCTVFSRAGSRHWPSMDSEGRTAEGVALFRAAMKHCERATRWCALENPPGRHQSIITDLSEPAWQFQPYEYGDPWMKQTYIWGTAVKPPMLEGVKPPPTYRTPNGKTQGRIGMMSGSDKAGREETPKGFALAFFLANP